MPSTAASFQSPPEQLLERTRGLFSLLVCTCDGSRFRASRCMETDLRTIDELRSVPSLRLIDRMGAALGLNASLAAEVLATEPRGCATPEEIRGAIADADLAEDSACLERLAAELQRRPTHPADLGLAHIVRARAAIARGDVAQAAAETEGRQKLWRWFLAATLLILGIETIAAGWAARRSTRLMEGPA